MCSARKLAFKMKRWMSGCHSYPCRPSRQRVHTASLFLTAIERHTTLSFAMEGMTMLEAKTLARPRRRWRVKEQPFGAGAVEKARWQAQRRPKRQQLRSRSSSGIEVSSQRDRETSTCSCHLGSRRFIVAVHACLLNHTLPGPLTHKPYRRLGLAPFCFSIAIVRLRLGGSCVP